MKSPSPSPIPIPHFTSPTPLYIPNPTTTLAHRKIKEKKTEKRTLAPPTPRRQDPHGDVGVRQAPGTVMPGVAEVVVEVHLDHDHARRRLPIKLDQSSKNVTSPVETCKRCFADLNVALHPGAIQGKEGIPDFLY